MKNNPLNGYQPDHDEETAANAALPPETDAANIDPDTGEIIASADAAADTNEENARPTFYPTCRYCGKQSLPDAPYESQEVEIGRAHV